MQAFDIFNTFLSSPVDWNVSFIYLKNNSLFKQSYALESKLVLPSETQCCYCRILSLPSLYVRQSIHQINKKKCCHLLKWHEMIMINPVRYIKLEKNV